MKICGLNRLFLAAVLAVGIGMAGHADATLLSPGSVLIPASAELEPGGGTIVASSAVPFSVPGAFSGTLYSDVISGDATNALGGLTFVYRVENDGVSGPNSIGRFSVASMMGFIIDGSYNPTAGVAPATIDRNPFGDVVGFNFVPTPLDPLTGFLSPGLSSARLILQTNALKYTEAVASLIDGGVTTAPTFGPAVPEPASAGLAVVGLGSLLLARRRS